jgi:hypothetical protein
MSERGPRRAVEQLAGNFLGQPDQQVGSFGGDAMIDEALRGAAVYQRVESFVG